MPTKAPSIHIPADYFEWKQTRQLIQLLGRDAHTIPIRLWCHCARHPEDMGRLNGPEVLEIEEIVRWRGERGRALSALKEALFLMEAGPSELIVVDWERVGKHILNYKERAVHAINQRWKNTPSNTPSITPSNSARTEGQAGDVRLSSVGTPRTPERQRQEDN